MNPLVDNNELVRRFNDDEAVWRSYVRKRQTRQLLGPGSSLSESILDYLDWLKAGRECRGTRCIGRPIP